jgi:hypothetical protein
VGWATDLAEIPFVGMEIVHVHVLLRVPPALPAATRGRRRHSRLAASARHSQATSSERRGRWGLGKEEREVTAHSTSAWTVGGLSRAGRMKTETDGNGKTFSRFRIRILLSNVKTVQVGTKIFPSVFNPTNSRATIILSLILISTIFLLYK